MTTKHDPLKASPSNVQQDKSAGKFSEWLQETQSSMQGLSDANVSCGDCSACCNSSYFIHLKPSDSQALAHIPKELTFPAPGLPKGHRLMGYDEHGRCPMFIAGQCSIYAHRPQTCRQYDCRIFPATGLEIHEAGKEKILAQAKRWSFECATPQERNAFAAVQAAAKFINQYATHFPKGFIPSNTTQQAVMAIRIYEVFLEARAHKFSNYQNTIQTIMPMLDVAP